MAFEIKLDYTLQDYAAYWYAFRQKRPGQPPPRSAPPWVAVIFGGLWIVLGVLCLVAWLWLGEDLAVEGGGLINLLLTTPLGGLVGIALGVLCLRSRRAREKPWPPEGPPYPRWAKKQWKNFQAQGERYVCRFSQEDCWLHGPSSDFRWDYEKLGKLWTDGDRFYLTITGSFGAYILAKSAFTEGNPEDLPAFWHARTGKPVLEVHPARRKKGTPPSQGGDSEKPSLCGK